MTTIAATTEPEQKTKTEVRDAVYQSYSDALERYAPDAVEAYGVSTLVNSAIPTFCVPHNGESDEELLEDAKREHTSATPASVRQWYALTRAYDICSFSPLSGW